MSSFQIFLWGALAMASLTSTALFIKFWRTSKDPIFFYMATAFAVLSVHWALLTCNDQANENRPYIYGVRLLAFGLIILGIVRQSVRASRGPPR